jgi:glycosyltransferase involved in cell wall biosynthesis
MLGDAQIAVVVPAYNEVLHVAAVLRAMPTFVDRVIVVDDGSADGTAEAACGVTDARVRVVSHACNRGVGAALKTGYRVAFDAGADIVAVMAGDGQMHPDDLLQLLGPVLRGEADYVKGDRLSHPEARARMPRMRFIGNHLLSALTRVCTGSRVRDSQCGYTALSRRALERLPLAELWEGYGYPNDMLGWLCANRAQVCDIVVRPVYGLERSGIGLRHALIVIPFVLARIVLRRIGLVRGEQASTGAGFASLALDHNPDSN